MNPMTTLSNFFDQADPTTLNTCDREAIHLTGKIQNLGALLIIDPETITILGASQNAAGFLGSDPDRFLGRSLNDIDPVLAQQVSEMTLDDQVLHQILEYEISVDGAAYDCIAHVHAERLIVEFVPNVIGSDKELRKAMRQCSKASAQIMQSNTFDDACQIAVDKVREITGFSRAKIYQFQSDWSGEVVAESSDGVLPSYLGLRFPSGDIPAQAREMMKIVACRAIGSVSDVCQSIQTNSPDVAELDLTWSILRSVSTMHTQYLRNIGVGCSFSCGLMQEGALWGMIALHNNDPQLLPFDMWSLLQEIGTALMLKNAEQKRMEIAESVTQLRVIEAQFSKNMQHENTIEDVIAELVPELQAFLNADGFAFQFGPNLHVSGRTPPERFITELLEWTAKNTDPNHQFQTNELQAAFPQAAAHKDTACGVLIQPMAVHRVCQLIWFRGPLARTVKWAGRPVDKHSKGHHEVLGPRHSFETWVQDHDDQSAPWKDGELQCAREIFTEFLDIITSQFLLREENENLRQFAASAAHDLKAPMRGINLALDWMSEDDFEMEAVKQHYAIAKRSSKQMNELAESLLELSDIADQTLNPEPVRLEDVLQRVEDLLFREITEHNARLTRDDLPTLTADPQMILRVLLNLVSNAIKFRNQGTAPIIHVASKMLEDGAVEISVTDNGLGIAASDAKRIFVPLERLHTKSEIEGSGLGLAICDKVMAAHGGTITLDVSHTSGARFVLLFPPVAQPVA